LAKRRFLIAVAGIFVAAVAGFILLGLKGDKSGNGIIAGCAVLLAIAVVAPQTLSKLS